MLVSYQHQIDVLARSQDRATYALFLEPGCGKSHIAIRTMEHQFREHGITTVLLLCPKSLINTWALIEIPKHSQASFSVIRWPSGGKAGFTDNFTAKFKSMCLVNDLLWVIVNHDAIITPTFDTAWAYVAKHREHRALVVDESTAYKTHNSKRTKKAIKLSQDADVSRILTGTPVTKWPLDLFSQCQVMSPGNNLLGTANYYGFLNRYVVRKTISLGFRSVQKIVGFKNLDILKENMETFSSIIKLADCVDLPDRIFKQVEVELTSEQKKHYNSFLAEARTEIEGQDVTAINVLALMSRLHQITCGQIKLGDDSYVALENDRPFAVREQLEEIGQPTIVWCPYVEASRMLAEALGPAGFRVMAEMSPASREAVFEAWRAACRAGEIAAPALILNPAFAGFGLTLNEAKAMIYYSRSYNLEHRLQSLARNYRIGQTDRVQVVDLVSTGTIDEKIFKALKAKESLADMIMNKRAILDMLGEQIT